jgi:hypothetical protein
MDLKLTVPRYQNASAVMVWVQFPEKGIYTSFIDRGVKINEYYKTEILERILLPEAHKLYGDEYYCFQQDGAPSHTANTFRGGAKIIGPISFPKMNGSPSSPDMNLLDFSICDYLLGQLRNYKYAILPEFKKVIQRL